MDGCPISRRRLLIGSSLAGVSVFGGVFATGWSGRKWTSDSGDHSSLTEGPTVSLDLVFEGLKQPLALENPVKDHLFVADKFGQVYVYSDGTLQDTPVLDIADQLVMEHGEQGLIGLEFHPEFKQNNRFYVRYSSPRREETPETYSHTAVLSEFRMRDDYRGIVEGSERSILEIPEPGQMHNAGAVEFGPDGYLYVSLGDGGGDGHDGSGPLNRRPGRHAGDWYWLNVGGNGQDTDHNLHGSVLRIDVNGRNGEKPYAVPDENPLTGDTGLDEHYAWGFRNPYSMSFDGEDLYVTDVGTKIREEVNIVEKGGNYGWNVKEGQKCHNNFPPLRALSAIDMDVRALPVCPSATSDGRELHDPVITYPGELGAAIIGGQVYKNSAISELNGKYVFGDLAGRLFSAVPSTENRDGFWTIEELSVARSGQSEASKYLGKSPLAIERGNDGELYVLTTGQTGGVHRIRNV